MSCLLHDDNPDDDPDDDSRVSYVPFSIPHPILPTTASYVAAAGGADCDTFSLYDILCLCCMVYCQHPIYSSYDFLFFFCEKKEKRNAKCITGI